MLSLPHYSQSSKLVPNCPSEYTMELWNKIGNDDDAKIKFSRNGRFFEPVRLLVEGVFDSIFLATNHDKIL